MQPKEPASAAEHGELHRSFVYTVAGDASSYARTVVFFINRSMRHPKPLYVPHPIAEASRVVEWRQG